MSDIHVLVPVAPGFEEIETASIVDILRRAGVRVTLAGVDGHGPVVGSREIAFVPDASLENVAKASDALVLPGGLRNAERLAADPRILRMIRERVEAGRLTAAICAAPLALDAAGVLQNIRFTCHPSVKSRLAVGTLVDDPVVDSGVIVTSRGPGTAMAFALHLVERLKGTDKRREVADALVY